MELNAEDIRYARPCDLAALTHIDASSFTAWTRGRAITDRYINEISKLLNMPPEEFLKGWNQRRQDAKRVQETVAKMQILIAQRSAA